MIRAIDKDTYRIKATIKQHSPYLPQLLLEQSELVREIDWSTYKLFNKAIKEAILIACTSTCFFPPVPVLKSILLEEQNIRAFFRWIAHYQGTRTWHVKDFNPYTSLSEVFSQMSMDELEIVWKKLGSYECKGIMAACCPLTFFPLVMDEKSENCGEWKHIFEQRLQSKPIKESQS